MQWCQDIPGPSPIVVFENGLAGHKEVWNEVVPTITADHAVFAYDRPGVGHSSETLRPRDGDTIVEDLRALLQSRHLSPPYVLVGHSAGGLYLQLYARRYPMEVAALVLVDSTHPTQFEGDGSMTHRGALSRAAMAVGLHGNAQQEFNALSENGRQVLAAPPLTASIPLIILMAPDKSNSAIAAFDSAKRADFARLYPSAAMRVVDSTHMIPQDQPQIVIEAIREITKRVAADRL